MKLQFILVFFLSGWLFTAQGKLIKESVVYQEENVEMRGYLVYDDAKKSKRPGVLVIHDWMGIGPFSKQKAEDLARMGYVAFAVDLYGVKNRPKNTKEAGVIATQFKQYRKLLRSRVQSALKVLKSSKLVNPKKMVAIGYCFGGTAALELARSGADVSGVVSFHGGLSSSTPKDAKQIKGKVLILHGADDPLVPSEEVAAFQREMRNAKVDWQMISYGNAVHSFTNPNASNAQMKGVAYNATADRRSWVAMKTFFEELFGQ